MKNQKFDSVIKRFLKEYKEAGGQEYIVVQIDDTKFTIDIANEPQVLTIEIPDATLYESCRKILKSCVTLLHEESLEFDDYDEVNYEIKTELGDPEKDPNNPDAAYKIPMKITMSFELIR